MIWLPERTWRRTPAGSENWLFFPASRNFLPASNAQSWRGTRCAARLRVRERLFPPKEKKTLIWRLDEGVKYMEGSENKPLASESGPTESGPDTGSASSGKILDGLERIALQDKVVEVLRGCYDPEIPVNI